MSRLIPTKNSPTRSNERILLLVISVLLIALFGRLYYNLSPVFKEAEAGYKDGVIIQLSKPLDTKRLQSLLETSDYLNNHNEIERSTRNLAQKIETLGSPENLGALNKQIFQVKADSATIGSIRYKDALLDLGLDSAYFANESINHPPVSGSGKKFIEGTILSKENLSKSEWLISKLYSIIGKPYGKTQADVLIRLEQYSPTPAGEEIGEIDRSQSFYTKTDAQGYFVFNGLYSDSSYSVIPLKQGFEFGNKQGTKETGKLDKDLTFYFYSKPHIVKIFESDTYQKIKDDKAFTVRTPQEFKSWFIIAVLAFFIAFWLVHLVWSVRRFEGDTVMLPLLMLLTGISVLMMFAIQDPLRDTLRGWQTVQGVLIGLFVLSCISQIRVAKFFSLENDTIYFFKFSFKKPTLITTSWTWLYVAIVLMILLLAFGTGPEGSGVKVNLLFFQPSEITKYLVLLFFAGYFTKNATYLRHIPSVQWRLSNFWQIFVSFAFLLGIYLILGDMGPALVLCFTFLIFYASVRGELREMLIGATIYGLLLTTISYLNLHDKLVYLVVTVLYIILWVAYGYFKKDFKESAFFIMLLVAAFVFGENVPKFGERLKSRNDIWRNIWDNTVDYGGDQLAHGVWSLSSGGWFGQGLGKGYSKVMPANHTDMILPSIGEEIGFIGLILIIFCMGGLLYRSVLIARRAGQDFAFYLCAGVAIVTGSQFFLIASGSVGTIPLTGISVPFLSFGKAAMITNLAGFGIVLSISSLFSTKTQHEYIKLNYDPIIKTGKNAFLIGLAKMALVLFGYQIFNANDYIVKPAFVANRAGQRIYSQNPRIDILTRKLEAGNIYDRNGILLATSNKETARNLIDSLTNTGISNNRLLQKRLERYYPFGEHLLFWLGDINEGFSFKKAGYGAEYRHLTTLRGFDNHPVKDETLDSTNLRENAFLPPQKIFLPITKYDYSALIPILKAGIDTNSRTFKALKLKNRDIKLSVDAKLQTSIQQAIEQNDSLKKYRSSIVILNPNNGEVLASAAYPLPKSSILREISKIPSRDFNKRFKAKFGTTLLSDRDLGITYPTPPGSTAKIITAFAGLNTLGIEGTRRDAICRDIQKNERIREKGDDLDPIGDVSMETAIIHSSNVYFIWLSNKYHLDNQLFNLYETTGMNLAGFGKNYFGDSVSMIERAKRRVLWQKEFSLRGACDNEQKRGRLCSKYSQGISGASWGQDPLKATPLSIARMAGIIKNNGIFAPSQFLIEKAGSVIAPRALINIAEKNDISQELELYMSKHPFVSKFNLPNMAGKSGTPQRDYIEYVITKEGKRKKKTTTFYDGWFVFSAQSENGKPPVVVCVRIEHNKNIGSVKSGKARDLAKSIVEPQLNALGYFSTQTNL